jgi:hypothetical protein
VIDVRFYNQQLITVNASQYFREGKNKGSTRLYQLEGYGRNNKDEKKE